MTSRLDRLFVLLEAGAGAATRRAAARQLGEVQKAHPEELHRLLSRLMKHLRSPAWETRIAASQAVEAILANVPEWHPSPFTGKKEEKEKSDLEESGRLRCETFDIERVLLNGAHLMGSEGHEYDMDEEAMSAAGECCPAAGQEKQRTDLESGRLRCETFDIERVLLNGAHLMGSEGHEYDMDEEAMSAAESGRLRCETFDIERVLLNGAHLMGSEGHEYDMDKEAMSAAGECCPAAGQEKQRTDQESGRLRCETFDIERVLLNGAHLMGSEGHEYDMDEEAMSAADLNERILKQRQQLNARLGLDIAANLGVDLASVYSNEDLCPTRQQTIKTEIPRRPVQELVPIASSKPLSSREMNLAKRKARAAFSKQKSRDCSEEGPSAPPTPPIEPDRKKIKLEPLDEFAVENSSPVPDCTGVWGESVRWPLEWWCSALQAQLFSAAWESRHGAASALRELLRARIVASAGIQADVSKEQMDDAHQEWLEDMALRLLCVLALDRFGDFVSDQVVAPVRETCAQTLGVAFAQMRPDRVRKVAGLLTILARQSQWEARHGALLGFKYLLAARQEAGVECGAVEQLVSGLEDVAEDVSAAAASALAAQASAAAPHAPRLAARLWTLLQMQDDLAAPANAYLALLAALCSLPEAASLLHPIDLSDVLPRLWPYLDHSTSSVRKAALQTLRTLTRPLITSTPKNNGVENGGENVPNGDCNPDRFLMWTPELLQEAMRHVYQRILFEHVHEIQEIAIQVWENFLQHASLGVILVAACPVLATWLCLAMQPARLPAEPGLLLQPPSKRAPCWPRGCASPCSRRACPPSPACCCSRRLRYEGSLQHASLGVILVAACPVLATWLCLAMQPARLPAEPGLLLQPPSKRAPCWPRGCASPCSRRACPPSPACCCSRRLRYEGSLQHASLGVILVAACPVLATWLCLAMQPARLPAEPGLLLQPPSKGTHSSSKQQQVNRHVAVEPRDDGVSLVRRHAPVEPQQNSADTLLKAFLRCDPEVTPRVSLECTEEGDSASGDSGPETVKSDATAAAAATHGPTMDKYKGILTLREQQRACEAGGPRRGRPPANHPPPAANPHHELLQHEDEARKLLRIQRRGATYALTSLTKYFNNELPQKLPKLWEFITEPLLKIMTDAELESQEVEPAEELISRLQVFEAVSAHVGVDLWPQLCPGGAQACCVLARHIHTAVRHMAARALAAMAARDPTPVMHTVINELIPLLSDVRCERARCGAAEALARTVESLQLRVVPYIVLLVVPLLGRMSDHCEAVRVMSTRCFASLIQLMPLDGAVAEPPGLAPDVRARRLRDKHFLEKLFNPKSIQDYKIPVPVSAELRSYQQAGVNWLRFLYEYKLHGVLCDDMGLGKTLQSIVVVAGSHWERARAQQPSLPSLVVCPPTLTGHWVFEVNKFIPCKFLRPLQYVGPPVERERLRAHVRHYNLIVASYDIVRKDIHFFSTIKWNYCVLDEGHVIKNGKTKAFKAIKQLVANHRLILSGTPIQNNVLELWSLFDFLMPGLLGTERQFTARYSRPILAARDAKATPHQLQAGALACEALHRQVLPFLLRRVKEDVLKELPPKITQDYYCELSALQRRLYEHFSREHMPHDITSHTHVFQLSVTRIKSCALRHALDAGHWEQDLLKRHLPGVTYLRLDGSVPPHQRHAIVTRFNSDVSIDLLLLTTALSVTRIKSCALRHALDAGHWEQDLLKRHLPGVTYLRLDGSVPPHQRHAIVTRFNSDVSIDLLLLTTALSVTRIKSCALRHALDAGHWEQDLLKRHLPGVTYLRLDGSVPPHQRHAIVTRFNSDVSIDLLLLTTAVSVLYVTRLPFRAFRHAFFVTPFNNNVTIDLLLLTIAERLPFASHGIRRELSVTRIKSCALRHALDAGHWEQDLLKRHLPGVTYLRLDGSVPPHQRHAIVTRFNSDVSIDLLLLTTAVGGLGLNLTGADTVVFVEHDWNPMKDAQAMDRAHRIGQRKVVNVYRLITRGTLEEKIMGLQKFKLQTANTVISSENAAMETMGTDQLLDLFQLSAQGPAPAGPSAGPSLALPGPSGPRVIEALPDLWDDKQYEEEYDMSNFIKGLNKITGS
ncbi:TATA-binding protein-associated factor 172-like [Ostrinia furnacalis]|uniref:TATA-binding protein-associated factor 172-like n=1 Tax=Ostrinia furnacalis TaxID=93504 RepID=UPI00103D4430|nr:TATA-binding protein-associated factor 172-like [Ostrinia furnacalis]